MGGGALLEACSSGIQGASSSSSSLDLRVVLVRRRQRAAAASGEITIGWIHPVTGALAGFGVPGQLGDPAGHGDRPSSRTGSRSAARPTRSTVKSYDTQSSVTKAGTLAKQAIQQDNVDLLFASSTPETVNAVASQAEALGTPLICSNVPWESWYINLGGNPQKPTLKPKHTVMYFLGAEHLALAFKPMWDRIGEKYGNNHQVAAAFPNDSDGNAFRAVFPAVLKATGYKLDISAAYPDGLTNYTSMITQFKSHGRRLLHQRAAAARLRHHVDPGAAAGLQAQARHRRQGAAVPDRRLRHGQQGLQHRHRLLVGARPCRGTPRSTGETCPDLATAYTAAGLGQPNANISNYTLFEIAYAALTSVNNPHDKAELSAALFKVKLDEAVAGPIDYTSTQANPAPGVAITPPVGIQWQKGTKYPLEAVVVDNTLQPNAKITGDLLPTFSCIGHLNNRREHEHSTS